MSDATDYKTALEQLAEWAPKLLAEVKKQFPACSDMAKGSPISTTMDVHFTVELGGALVQLAVEECGGQHRPMVVVTEKVLRKHRIGIGHSHNYYSMAAGMPNFKKIVKNAVQRADEVALTGGDAKPRQPAENLDTLQHAELQHVRLPEGMIVTRCRDGGYVIHIGTLKTTLDAVKAVSIALRT